MLTQPQLPYRELYHLAKTLQNQHMDTSKIMQTLLSRTGEMLDLQQGFLVTFNEDDTVQGAYVLNSAANPIDNGDTLWQMLLQRGLIGFVYHGQRTVVIRNIRNDARWPSIKDNPVIPREGAAVGIPLRRGSSVFGLLMFIHPVVDYFNDPLVELLEEIADLGAAAINNAWDFGISGKANIRYQTLFEDAVVPIVLTDLHGKIVGINRKGSDMLFYERHDLLTKSIQDINQIDLNKLGKGGLQTLRPEEEVTFRSIALAANGEEIPVLVRARRLSLAEGNMIEWIQQDVSPQMELEQLRRDLTAMVYHDLRGPLQAIQGSISKLAQVLANHENPSVRTMLQIGLRSTRQLRRMIDALLDVQRLEEGEAILDRNPIEMRVVLADATQLVQPLALDAGQSLKFDLADNLPMVTLDSDMILRVIINLMENAIKYTPDGGTITLGARIHENCIRISVSDSGPGIPADQKQRIFDKFNRIKYRNAPQGVGLGLAFCRLAVQAHGGTIWVESEEGKGSEFIFTLPLEVVEDDLLTVLATSA